MSASTIRVGSAPDSWGVWFPDDDRQVRADRFLDEVSAAGYRWIELGPYGFLPTDPIELRDSLTARGLSLSAGTVFEHLHRPDSWDAVWDRVSDVAALTAAVGGSHVVVIPQMWRDPATGEALEERLLDAEQWRRKTSAVGKLGKAVFEQYGTRLQYHPHADSHVAEQHQILRFLADTDPEHVGLCLDTGHVAYCGGDNIAIIRAHPERIGYLHLKQVDQGIVDRVRAQDLPFGEAVKSGVMIEPPHGVPDLPTLLAEIDDLAVDIFAIVEQDLYPCAPDVPLPIAARTRRYLGACGVPSLGFC